MKERFIAMLENIGVSITDTQLNQFEQYYQTLIAWNNKVNLTSITDRDEVYLKHFYDSACLVKAIPLSNQHILDVGSGAGFPSIPLKILFPALNITIIDAMNKRIRFLQELTDTLHIDVHLIHGRAEEFEQREHFDIVTARAVANMQILSELCIPFVRVDGHFLAMKGPNHEEELVQATHAFDTLNATVEDVITYTIEHFDRSIIILRKTATTATKYPRRYKKIKSKPL